MISFFLNYDFFFIQLSFFFICYLLMINYFTFSVITLASCFMLIICILLAYFKFISFVIILLCVEAQVIYIILCLAFTFIKFDSININKLDSSVKNIAVRFFVFVIIIICLICVNNFFLITHDITLNNIFIFKLYDIIVVNNIIAYKLISLLNLFFNTYFIYNSFEFFLINFFITLSIILLGNLVIFYKKSLILSQIFFFKKNYSMLNKLNDVFLKKVQHARKLNTAVCTRTFKKQYNYIMSDRFIKNKKFFKK